MRALERVRVAIERDTSTIIPREVFAYELPILQAIHLPEMVHEKGTATVKVDWNAEAAHDALRRRYGDRVVFHIYPRPADLARRVEPQRKSAE